MAPKSRAKRTNKSARKATAGTSPETPAATTAVTTSAVVETTPSEITIDVETTPFDTSAETAPETNLATIHPETTTTIVDTTPLETSARTSPETTIATIPLDTTATETTVGTSAQEASGKLSEQETADKSTEQEIADKTAVKQVVKKTVRKVKKVIKKKVLKRVPKAQDVSSNCSVELPKPELPLRNGEGNNPSVSGLVEVENSKQSQLPEPKGFKSVSAVVQSDEVTKTQLNVQNAEPVGTRNDGCEDGNIDGDSGVGGDGQESVLKEEVENCEDGGGPKEEEVENCENGSGHKEKDDKGNGAVRDEETDVSERRKRRKTEIFIGGLGKDAKEEDIRKVFEKIGEIVEVRLMKHNQTGKNKGYAFLRYASAADAKRALTKYSKVEICGKQCGTEPVGVNDRIFLGNIDKKWKKEDIVKLLHDIGIEKIDTITLVTDPNNAEYNRGYAFLELDTNKDAQSAYKKLQKKDAFGKGRNIKIAWAEPLNEPDEEEMLKVKSVYAECLPSYWDEKDVKKHFEKFGEIDRVVLARNMHSARRKDFAFVNYTTREAALACIESINKEGLTDERTKLNVRASLAKPIPKGKQNKGGSRPVTKDHSKEKPKTAQRDTNLNASSNKAMSEVVYGYTRDRRSSTSHELTQVLREQAPWRPGQISLSRGYRDQDYAYPMAGGKRSFSALGGDVHFSDPRSYPRACLDSSFSIPSSSILSQGISGASLLYYQPSIPGHKPDSPYGSADHSRYLQTKLGAAPYGSGLYRKY
ncbi:nucleolin 2-like [Telopea speciosissima]|uniref:nucleolin 2-like n=1 Tax=Telopea speciosissima TaxID=54955 RepID=UPI001CC7C5CB|nr:nucleolin 2-like [Telopea speciosissima]